LKQNCMGSPLGAAKHNSLLQGAASLDRLGTTGLDSQWRRPWFWKTDIDPMGFKKGALTIQNFEKNFFFRKW